MPKQIDALDDSCKTKRKRETTPDLGEVAKTDEVSSSSIVGELEGIQAFGSPENEDVHVDICYGFTMLHYEIGWSFL